MASKSNNTSIALNPEKKEKMVDTKNKQIVNPQNVVQLNVESRDEDSEILKNAIDKNIHKSKKYQTSETDSLFEVITKTYVRNYCKLIKKDQKDIEKGE
ncbi:MAG: hypothetical protein HOP07_06475 [Bacteriovoracaceae bacterium]|nr:hypothetical protein [Bacteriovoracaceae bacterium]